VTKLALGDFVFQDKNLEFVSAYDGEQAKQMFREHDDIAVVLLDVVMETDDAGLLVAEFIRNEMDNHFTRIILRTGQPGQAPERDVIINYDINDYKSKTELT
jgi:CheY-like chemotaxis protein